jgi:Spy/CpxP family protein refolding chaperone
MKKIIEYSAIALFIFTFTMAAQPGPANKEAMPNGIIKKLNLTPEQEKQFKDIRYQQQKKAIDLRSQIQKNRLEVKHMFAVNNIDEKKILELTDANSKIQGDLKNSAMQSWLSIYKILTPEQKEIWAKHFENMGGKMGMRAKMMQRFNDKLPNLKRQMKMEKFDNKPMGMMNFQNEDELGMLPPLDGEDPVETDN